MIDITGVNLVELAKKAYELSSPQGLGVLHFEAGGLTDEEAKELISEDDHWGPLSMDYVKGRAVKLKVRKDNGRLLLNDSWYDHTDSQYQELLRHIGIEAGNPAQQHGGACNCGDCRIKRGEDTGPDLN